MDVNGTYLFNAPQDEVWKAVLDPDVLSKSLPGIQSMEAIGENKYRAVMKVRLGPVQGQGSTPPRHHLGAAADISKAIRLPTFDGQGRCILVPGQLARQGLVGKESGFGRPVIV